MKGLYNKNFKYLKKDLEKDQRNKKTPHAHGLEKNYIVEMNILKKKLFTYSMQFQSKFSFFF